MPYIEEWRRDGVNYGTPSTPGELNYLISKAVGKYIEDKGLSYGRINEAIGVLECAKLELYRRIAVPYEDTKRGDNGDVYPQAIGGDFGG